MPKPLQYFLAWAVATSLGVGVALLGVQVVLESTSAQRPALVKAPEPVSAGSQLSTATSLATTPAPTPSSPTPRGSGPSASRRPSPSKTSTPTQSRTSKPPTGKPELCDDQGTGSVIESYDMFGGSAAVRFAPGRVCLVSAAPRPGHVVNVSPEAPDRLVVRFRDDGHQSELVATWAGTPVAQTRETFW